MRVAATIAAQPCSPAGEAQGGLWVGISRTLWQGAPPPALLPAPVWLHTAGHAAYQPCLVLPRVKGAARAIPAANGQGQELHKSCVAGLRGAGTECRQRSKALMHR